MAHNTSSSVAGRWDVVLFDLDGTLIDSAPDLAGTGNDLRRLRGLAPLPLSDFRPHTGTGARGLLAVALGVAPDHADFESLKTEFLSHYEQRMARETTVFADMAHVLDRLDATSLRWGIVTNKAERFARPLAAALGLLDRAQVLVCGDSVARAKPHPDPLLEAARQLAMRPDRCLYVGDDLRDVQAGRSAGMATAAAAWGYLGAGTPIETWESDHILVRPEDLLVLMGLT